MGEHEFQHGRISPSSLRILKSALSSVSPPPVNILLCHHHPHKHTELGLGDYDEMADGQLLLELLGSGEYGEWIVIHGHKHHPKLCYAHGGSSAPVIFSAGSLCHTLYPELATLVQRQFYILSFPYDAFARFGLVGTFRAWDWEFGGGWGRPTRKSGLPATGGFGHRAKPQRLAANIATTVAGKTRHWDYITIGHPELAYVLPSDLLLIERSLRDDFHIGIQSDDDGAPLQIGPMI
jgi:hypothetical protein